MSKYTSTILKVLKENMSYVDGETILIITQDWNEHLGHENQEKMQACKETGEVMQMVFEEAGLPTTHLSYIPEHAVNGADATQELYDEALAMDIVFMPTAFSLTHTAFRKTLTDAGARVASMPGFTLTMFDEGGPLDVDNSMMLKATQEVEEKLKKSRYVRITAKETDMVVEVNPTLIHSSDGILKERGSCGNLPGAETFFVPTFEGNSNGFFTVPVGFGGETPLKHEATFLVEQGRIVDVKGKNEEAQEYINKEVKPHIFDDLNHDVLAECGIGTNPAVTVEYIKQAGWSTLVAEKIWGSAHFAHGNSKGMGGENDVPIHQDFVVPDVQIEYAYQP